MDGIKYPEHMVYGLDIGTRSVVGTVGFKQTEQDFIVAAQCVKFHETRAMLDGQIHDIGKVSDTIRAVTSELEKQTGRKLEEVCIAAAGRVLKTVTVKVMNDFEEDTTISQEHIHSLEMLGIENAYEIVREETKDNKIHFYCVGYSVVHYYLNDFVILNLEDHKGSRISAEILATFLPEEVVDGLYAAVEKSGLQVSNLTLEPIAAIRVAIPENFRLLNIALVDVGAGTSDICITKDGSIIAYGMVPVAGDEITDLIAKNHLVDFQTAESIKIAASMNKKQIFYKDIMGISHKITPNDIIEETDSIVNKIAQQIAERIIELNGDKAVSAVFIVGGGGKLSNFTEALAKSLNLLKERVALRGEEVLGNIHFMQEDIKKDPLLVTPIGICLNYCEQKNNFIYVMVNKEQVKLYDNSKLTIVDAALRIGFPNESLFPKRGKSIRYTLDGAARMIRGETGEAAVITLNNKITNINSPIQQKDIIEITESTAGADAKMEIGQLQEFHGNITIVVNGKFIECPKYTMVNGAFVTPYYLIQDGDELRTLNYYTLEQVLQLLELSYSMGIQINNQPAELDDRIYENFNVEIPFEDRFIGSIKAVNKEEEIKSVSVISHDSKEERETVVVIVNSTTVTLYGKKTYILVDVLDFFEFDISVATGSRFVIKLNGELADFTKVIKENDCIDLYWEP